MRVEWIQRVGVFRVVGSIVVILLISWNVDLGVNLLLGPGIPPPPYANVDRFPEAKPHIQSIRKFVDMNHVLSRPLFSPSRSIQKAETEPMADKDEIITTAVPSGSVIEFRGVVFRGNVLFAVCRTAEFDTVRLYQVGDELLGRQIVGISREELVLEYGGETETHRLYLLPEKSPASNNFRHKRGGQEGRLVIGYGAH